MKRRKTTNKFTVSQICTSMMGQCWESWSPLWQYFSLFIFCYFLPHYFCLKNGPTPASFHLFSVFSNKHYNFLQQIDVKKCRSSIWCWDSNPLEYESLPITTRPGLPPWLIIFVSSASFWLVRRLVDFIIERELIQLLTVSSSRIEMSQCLFVAWQAMRAETKENNWI